MRAFLLACILILLGTSAVTPLHAEVLIFNMGPAKAGDWPTARKVTSADPGWQTQKDLREHLRRGDGKEFFTNAITESAILGTAANAFRFPAAAGQWHVYVLCGAYALRPPTYLDFDCTVGGEKWSCQTPPARDGAGARYEHHTFVTQSSGTIEVKLSPRTSWCLAGIVAWRQDDAASANATIARIQQWTSDAELAKWQLDPPPPTGPEPPISQTDRTRGFYLWQRHWAEVVYPQTNPAPQELNPTLRLFASPGEYEPMSFIVRPLRDIKHAEVHVQAIGPVPADRIEVRKVRYVQARPNYDVSYQYRIVPDILDRWQDGPLPAQENARVWLTVHVPDDAPPGLYRGEVRFIGDGQSVSIPVQLRILAVALEEDPQHTYSIYYDHPLDRVAGAPDERTREYWQRKAELEHADMLAHGTRNITLSAWIEPADAAGQFSAKSVFDLLDAKLKLAAKYHFQPPYALETDTLEMYHKYMKVRPGNHLKGVKMPPEAFFREITALTQFVEKERQQRGWPAFVYYPIDEPGEDAATVQFMVAVLRAVKAAGVRTYVTADPTQAAFEPLKDVVDIWCTQPFLPSRESVLADMKARGVEYWCYPNHVSGENDHTPVAGARMTYGFGFWRSGFLRLIPWIYQSDSGDPFNYLDGRYSDFLNRSEPDGTPLPVAMWEAYREGYDDYRYIYTLRQAIAQAQADASEPARQESQEAQKLLDLIASQVPILAKYQYEGFWSPQEMDVQRWQIASELEKLQALLRHTP